MSAAPTPLWQELATRLGLPEGWVPPEWLPFALALSGGILLLAVALWLVGRARRPRRQDSRGARPRHEWRRHGSQWGREAMAALSYLSTRKEWRYRLPWVLLLGEKGAGKSSIAASLGSGRRQQLLMRERQLPMTGTEWAFFDRGVVIDVEGATVTAPPGARGRWQEILDQLDRYRPERPLDGVVLTLSAETLLSGDPKALQELGEHAFRQLWELQKRLEFSIPVYLVVNRCDAVPGFTAFWEALPESRRSEMLGWASPYGLRDGFTSEWVGEAFTQLDTTLRELQLGAAADLDRIAHADEFFLFPRRLQALRLPLETVLETVLRPGALHEDFPLRGIWLSGAAEPGETPPGVRSDLCFVDELFDQKVFRELNLARPTRQGILSRNRLIRRVQLGAIGAAVLLLLALGFSMLRLSGQVDAALAALDTVRQPPVAAGEGECVGRKKVYELLGNVARIDLDLAYPTIPASWFDHRMADFTAGVVADGAFEEVIFPSMACLLKQRAMRLEGEDAGAPPESDEGLGAQRRALLAYTAEVKALVQQLADFREVAAATPPSRAEHAVKLFSQVAEYVYGEPLPAEVRNSQGQFRRALVNVIYPPAGSGRTLPELDRTLVETALTNAARDSRAELKRDLEQGNVLVKGLDERPSFHGITELRDWLRWLRDQWLDSTPQRNACQEAGQALGTTLDLLGGKPPAVLTRLVGEFSEERCYQPVMQKITALRIAPYGQVFSGQPGSLELRPELVAELEGLDLLLQQPFMEVDASQPFQCRLPLSGWRRDKLVEALNYDRQFREFIRNRGLTEAGPESARPIYERLARRQLAAVMDQLLYQAQEKATLAESADGLWVSPLSQADQQLAQRSNEFEDALESLDLVLASYAELSLEGSRQGITQCARDFSARTLENIDTLAAASRLYEPTTASGSGEDKPFFELGSQAQTKDYLSRQQERTRILAGYATPFVTFLKNTEAVNDANLANAQTRAYWEATVRELGRYVQFKENEGQVAWLDELLLKRLSGMTPQNCAGRLADYAPQQLGNDLFSIHRERLELQADWYCTDRSQSAVYDDYRELAVRFNRDLAGRFPFGPTSAQDVDPRLLKAFSDDYQGRRAALRKSLEGLKGEEWQELPAFLDDLDRALAFLDAGNGQIGLKVGFRYAPERSPGSDQVLTWRLDSGLATASWPNGATSLEWSGGDKLGLTLDWAALSRFRPQADPEQGDLNVTGRRAEFTAEGQWALPRLVEAHRVTGMGGDPARAVLRLELPVRDGDRSGQARMYLSLDFSAPDPTTGAPAPLDYPERFPQSAPRIW